MEAFFQKVDALSLSAETKVWLDASKADFQDALARWTDIDKQEPAAIIFPASEEDVVNIVKLAVENSIPFVPKSGGHSAWSTIGKDGFVLDLSQLRGVTVDVERQTATVSAGTQIGDLCKALDEKGFVTAHGTVNTVGFIPSTVGGGLTVLAPLVGYGSDQIISARLVTAKGELISISETENTELLYAIKGAGQFFGIITSLTVKVHPENIVSDAGTIWHTTLIFDKSKAKEVTKALLDIKRNAKRSYAMVGILPAPVTFDPVILLIAVYLGSAAEGKEVFAPVFDLGPAAVAADAEVRFNELNKSFEAFEAKGGHKRWLAPGLTSVDQFAPEDMDHFVEQQARVAAEYPNAKYSGYVIEFTSKGDYDEVSPEKETAFSHRDVAMFSHLLSWASDEESLSGAQKIADELLMYVRRKQPKEEYSFYQNFSRAAPIEERYRGAERLERLRKLKQKWDPQGVFTKQLL